MPFVNDAAIPNAKNEYICWLDIMGTKEKMGNSVRTCAIFILKLHTAVLESVDKGYDINVYPVMDGVYITSLVKEDMEKTLFHIFSSLGKMFYTEEDINHKFLVKASVAFGPIIHGKDINNSINDQFAGNQEYKKSLLLGLPMIQAYEGEKEAAPFGVFIHESARAFYPDGGTPFIFKWWKWFKTGKHGWNKGDTVKLKKNIKDYFTECEKKSISLNYPIERIEMHKSTAEEYFE